jgi:deoxyguanosine kinase
MNQASPCMLADISSTDSAFFSVEGNIGCGKSSFLRVLRARLPEVQWIEEPVEEWKEVGAGKANLLERYYADPQRWGFTFQVFAAFTRLRNMQQACQLFPNKVKISERSILADKHVFSEIMS